jgi:hypothetical protein
MRTQTKLTLGFAAIFTLGIWVALLAGAALWEMRRDEKRLRAVGDILGIQFVLRGFLTAEKLNFLAPNGADKELDERETKLLLHALAGVVNELNPSGLVYWWPDERQRKAGVIKDPWGRDYRIAVDVNGDGRVVTSCCGEITTTNVAVLWSVGDGPVTTWEYGQNLGGSVTKPGSN